VRDYSRIYGLKTVVFRQSCIYGKGQFGIEDQGWIAWFVIATLTGRPVKLYGNGKQVRDVLFVDDLVSAYIKAIENIDVASGKIYNLGGGFENSISILELFGKLKDQHDIEVRWKYDQVRPGDQKIFISDNRDFYNDTGWQPEVGVDRGISELVAWTKENIKQIRSLY
jgi:CDP-paratose 2-epimerase